MVTVALKLEAAMIVMKRALAVSAALCLLLAAGCVAADFSADLYAGQKSLTKAGKVNSSGGKLRIESNMGKMTRVMIVRADKRMVWALDPASRTYMEMPVPKGQNVDPRSDAMFAANSTKKNLGTEKVSGYACQKTAYVSRGNPKASAIRWYSSKLQYPVKIQVNMPGGQTSTQELRNVKVAKQSASLFEIPKGYKKIAAPKAPPGKRPMTPKPKR